MTALRKRCACRAWNVMKGAGGLLRLAGCAGLLAGSVFVAAGAAAERTGRARTPSTEPSRPNIVFVLTDDLDTRLLQYMPHVQAMQRDGLSFSDYFVSDSLCCPSRASIFTGELPHDSGVWRNAHWHGGVGAFQRNGDEQQSFAVALKDAGYQTAMMGKYLNRYTPGDSTSPNTHVPPGWSEWDVAGPGYPEFNYWLNQDGAARYYGQEPSAYLTDVIADKAVSFIEGSADAGQPFFLELATFAPHGPYTPAPRDATSFPGLRAPRPPDFNLRPTNPPGWLARERPLTAAQLAQIDKVFRKRVQSVQAVDQMIARVEATLSEKGLLDNTYIVFSSDNGYHMGDYGLMPGKLTAFDTDIRVPLIVVGPGVPADVQKDVMTENIDLAATFAEIGGATLHGDGHSLLSILHGQPPVDWRNAVLVEHHGIADPTDDPDRQPPRSGNPGPYEALRTSRFLYVEYTRYQPSRQIEYYDLQADPLELHNIAAELTPYQRALLHADVSALERCHDEATCWTAMHARLLRQPPKPY